jgi:hypothetical protein
MSHAVGEVWTVTGELKGYFEYNGTADVACTKIFLTETDLWNNWRKNVYANCTCEDKNTLVILYSDYGYGFCWLGKACLICNAITEGLSPDSSLRRRPFELNCKITE